MTERMIQVPVSLIERIAASSIENPDEDALVELSALLSQPTPTAEHADDCCYLEEDVVEPHGSRINPNAHCTCEPPRIDDMAPGTTFTEASGGWPRSAWTVGQRRGVKYVKRQSDGWVVLDLDYFDPSTIRDVRAPA